VNEVTNKETAAPVTERSLLGLLQEEKAMRLSGGLYHQTQIQLAYNSNRIEGSKLSEAQTRAIFETNTLSLDPTETANVDDIIETVNHFSCFDYMLDSAEKDLSEGMIKEFHRLLKSNTSDSRRDWFKVGDYKSRPNVVGGRETTAPAKVPASMAALLRAYHQKSPPDFAIIIDFHYHFERIHPFQDGNGRVGRLIIFKECLKHGIIPPIIEDDHKLFYHRGLKEYPDIPGYLTDTCCAAQDRYAAVVGYFMGDRQPEAQSHGGKR
jgi:Fic family protein